MTNPEPESRSYLPDPVVGTLLVIMVAIEATFLLADLGIISQSGLRGLAYQYAGFWPGLLGDWAPNYAYQSTTMFFTYALLHGGIGHLGVNIITLWSLGHGVINRVGRSGFALLYFACVIGGALGYAALWSTPQPMVGASGALFGLAGAILAWEYVDRFTSASGTWFVLRVVAMLIALNVVLYFSMDGQLAWQTHLGGFVSGWIMAMLIDPRPRAPEDVEDEIL